jgi:hypothetical protein
MSPKPEGSFEVAQPEHRWVARSLARAGVHLGQAVTGVVSERLEALEERLNSSAIPKSGGAAHGRMRDLLNQDRALLAVRDGAARKVRDQEEEEEEQREPSVVQPKRASSRGAAQGRMRELLQRDRAMLAGNDDWDDDVVAPAPPVKAQRPMAAQPAAVAVVASPVTPVKAQQPMAAEPMVVAVVASPVIRVSEPPAAVEAKKAAPAEAGDENAPIRTRTMARLFALQGHKDKALSIYDELIKRDPWDNGLIEEAERLRR